MTLQERLMSDLRSAMREGDVERREAIRLLRAAVLNEEIEVQHPLDDDETLAVVQRLVKRHLDSIDQFKRGNRPDLVAHEEAQLTTIRVYLPVQMLPWAEVEERVKAVIAETGASGRQDLGKVMPRLSQELRDRADMREVSRLVQELLRG